MNLLRLSWKNLTFKPLAMLLSIVLFALGIGLVSLLLLTQDQLEKNFEKNLAGIDLVIGAKGSPLQLILSSMYHLDAPTGNISLGEVRPFLNPKHPLIEQAVPLSLGDSHRGFRIVGTTPNIIELYDASLTTGQLWQQNLEAVLGARVARELNLKVGSTFSSSHGFLEDDNLAHDDTHFTVTGILAANGSVLDQLILTTNQTYWQVHEHEATPPPTTSDEHEHHDHDDGHDHSGHDHAAHEALPPLKPLLTEADDKELTALMLTFKGRSFQALNMQRSINENTDMQAATPAIEITRLYELMGTGEQALRMLALVIILVSGLSIFISLFSSLKERRYELALLRVQGASRGQLFLLIITEGLLLALVGYICGILLSHGGMHLLGGQLEQAYGYDFSAWTFLRAEGYLFLGALVLGLVAAVIPAVQASRVDIGETLGK